MTNEALERADLAEIMHGHDDPCCGRKYTDTRNKKDFYYVTASVDHEDMYVIESVENEEQSIVTDAEFFEHFMRALP